MSGAKSYTITTLRSIYEQVPTDKISACLAQIAAAMQALKALSINTQWPDSGVWTDDEKAAITLNFKGEVVR